MFIKVVSQFINQLLPNEELFIQLFDLLDSILAFTFHSGDFTKLRG